MGGCALVCSPLEYCIQTRSSNSARDITTVEKVCEIATKSILGFRRLTFSELLCRFNLFDGQDCEEIYLRHSRPYPSTLINYSHTACLETHVVIHSSLSNREWSHPDSFWRLSVNLFFTFIYHAPLSCSIAIFLLSWWPNSGHNFPSPFLDNNLKIVFPL